MNAFFLLTLISIVLVSATPTWAEPYSPSCETSLEKLHKARKTLVPFQRTMELSIAREREAYGELTICSGGGIFSADKAIRCNEVQWQAPERTKDVITAEDQYLQGREKFKEFFEQARRTCLLE